jgi:hypothetical protein
LYRFHPWSGVPVFIHEAVEKADGAIFRCSLSCSVVGRRLEVPAWMFDRAACVGHADISAEPFVDILTLSALAGLLADVLKAQAASPNALVLGAPLVSRNQIRGETHGKDDVEAARRKSAGATAEAAADGPVRKRPGRQRDRRTGMARVAGGSTRSTDQPDGATDSRACGQKSDDVTDGGRS